MTGPLFQEEIGSWEDWAKVFQSIPAFTPLAREICRREKLPWQELSPLTPGTNGVFRCGDFVLKIFFPKEAGPDPEGDFQNELAVARWVLAQGIPTPAVVAQGWVEDKYRFFYLVTQFAQGREAGDWLVEASPLEQEMFIRRLKDLLQKLNRPASGTIVPIDLKDRARHNDRLQKLTPSLREELLARLEGLTWENPVLVHGDLTGENLLVREDGNLVLLDCADACLAPSWYELGPLVFELFRCQGSLLKLFAGVERELFVERVLDCVCLHDFGADFLYQLAQKEDLTPFTHLDQVRTVLWERMN